MEAAEAFALLIMVDICKKELAGGHWIVWVDNEPVRLAMKAGRAKTNDWCGMIVRHLWSLRAEYDFDLEIRRVSSKKNVEADMFSRKGMLHVVRAWLVTAGMGPLTQVLPGAGMENLFVTADKE